MQNQIQWKIVHRGIRGDGIHKLAVYVKLIYGLFYYAAFNHLFDYLARYRKAYPAAEAIIVDVVFCEFNHIFGYYGLRVFKVVVRTVIVYCGVSVACNLESEAIA